MSQNTSNMIVQAGSLPEGFCPTSYQDFYNAIVARLIVQAPSDLSFFVTGSIAPTYDVGPWLKDGLEWWVWDVTIGAYRPMVFTSLENTFVPTGCIMTFAGLIADIPDGYLLCDGATYDISTWPALYSVIGTQYGDTGCSCDFKVPDLRNYFIVGAQEDNGGTAKSTVSDGATLLKNRSFTPHIHPINAPVDYPQDGTNTSIAHILVSQTGDDSPRAIPPFVSMAMMIKT